MLPPELARDRDRCSFARAWLAAIMLIAIPMTVRGIGFTCGVPGPSAAVSPAFDPLPD